MVIGRKKKWCSGLHCRPEDSSKTEREMKPKMKRLNTKITRKDLEMNKEKLKILFFITGGKVKEERNMGVEREKDREGK